MQITDETAIRLVERIQSGDTDAIGELYESLQRYILSVLYRRLQITDGLMDLMHDVFLALIQPIMRGDLRDATRLIPYTAVVANRVASAQIRNMVSDRSRMTSQDCLDVPNGDNPEKAVIKAELLDISRHIMQSMSPREQEILTRFYLNDEPREVIERDMRLTEKQFALFKSNTKQRFGLLVRNYINRRNHESSTNASGSVLGVTQCTADLDKSGKCDVKDALVLVNAAVSKV